MVVTVNNFNRPFVARSKVGSRRSRPLSFHTEITFIFSALAKDKLSKSSSFRWVENVCDRGSWKQKKIQVVEKREL